MFAVWHTGAPYNLQRCSSHTMSSDGCPVWGQPLPRRSTESTQINILGWDHVLPPLEKAARSLPGADVISAAKVDAANQLREPSLAWLGIRRAIAAAGALHIAILGSSSTAGCGAGEPWDSSSGNETLSQRCMPALSWPRRLKDELDALSPTKDMNVKLSVYYKAAVNVGHFARCTAQLFPSNAHVVLLEMANVIWTADVSRVVRSVRRVAPQAIVAFVIWPTKDKAASKSGYADVVAAAEKESADVIQLQHVLHELRAKPGKVQLHQMYAMHGSDSNHPSPWGHAIMAAAAARYISKQLSPCADRADRASFRSLARPPVESTQPWELCLDARGLRAASANGAWALVDEGRLKGVPKLGLVSTAVGEIMTTRLSGPPGSRCSLMRAELGYLISASRAELGGFRLSCTGCLCHPLVGFWDGKLNPWPELQTFAALAHDPSYWESNVSVTALTSFFVVWNGVRNGGGGQACELSIEHRPASTRFTHDYDRQLPRALWHRFEAQASQARLAPSRVRIDSLALSEANDELDDLLKRRLVAGSRSDLFCGTYPPPPPRH